jgi:hypothetical protein
VLLRGAPLSVFTGSENASIAGFNCPPHTYFCDHLHVTTYTMSEALTLRPEQSSGTHVSVSSKSESVAE